MLKRSSLTIPEAAALLRVSYGTIRRHPWPADSRLPFWLPRRHLPIDPADLEAYRASCVAAPTDLLRPKGAEGGSAFTTWTATVCLTAWRRQGVVAAPRSEHNARSSASSCDPSTPPTS